MVPDAPGPPDALLDPLRPALLRPVDADELAAVCVSPEEFVDCSPLVLVAPALPETESAVAVLADPVLPSFGGGQDEIQFRRLRRPR